ncbi:MAG: tyrosine-type recombinase/integrase [Nitratireductor sp.]|nr:tyrosine-type recombinase/integrase [Nitratireductor sp.]
MGRVELKYVVYDPSRHGTPRWYFRPPNPQDGTPDEKGNYPKKLRLPGEPGTVRFSQAYTGFMEQYHLTPSEPQNGAPGTLQSLFKTYQNSPEFKALAPATQAQRRRVMNVIQDEPLKLKEPGGKKLGQLPLNRIDEQQLLAIRDRKSDFPEAANHRSKMLRKLMEFARERKLIEGEPERALKNIRRQTEGHHIWTIDEIQKYFAFHPHGSTAWLAGMLLLTTQIRVGDLRRIGPQHRRGTEIRFQVGKGRKMASVFIPAFFAAQLDAMRHTHLTYMVTEFGKPFASDKAMSARVSQWATQSGLPHCTAHGIRKAKASIAAEKGATEHELKAMFTWNKLETAAIYTRNAEQIRLARQGAARIDWGEILGTECPTFVKAEDI